MQFTDTDTSLPIDPLEFIERNVGVGVYTLDTTTNEMSWSDGVYKVLNLAIGQVSPSRATLREMVHPEDRKPIAEMDIVFSAGRPFRFEHRLIMRDRRVRWISNQGEFFLDALGKPTIILGMLRDVSDIYDLQDSLSESKQLVAGFLGSKNGDIWTASANGDVTSVANWQNRYSANEEPLGRMFVDLVHPDEREKAAIERKADIAAGSTYTREHRMLHADGSYHWYRSTAVPIKGLQGSIRQWIGFYSDINEEKNGTKFLKLDAAMTGAQLRAARSILRLSVRQLFELSGVAIGTIRRLEEIDGPSLSDGAASSALRQALENGGVMFLFPDGLKPAVSPA